MRPLSLIVLAVNVAAPILWLKGHAGMALLLYLALLAAMIVRIRQWRADERERERLAALTVWIPPQRSAENPRPRVPD